MSRFLKLLFIYRNLCLKSLKILLQLVRLKVLLCNLKVIKAELLCLLLLIAVLLLRQEFLCMIRVLTGKFFSCHIYICQAFCYAVVLIIEIHTGIYPVLKHIYKLYLMIVICNVPLLPCKLVKLLLYIKKGLCHVVFLTVPACLGKKSLLDYLFY